MLFVQKRNGNKETMKFDKITERISKLINPPELQSLNLSYLDTSKETIYLDPIVVAQKVVAGMYPGITTEEIDLQSSEKCVNLSTKHPAYSLLGGRILISNLHKKTLNTFSDKVQYLADNTDIINKDFLLYVSKNKEALDNMVDYNRDYLFDYFGYKTLEKSYLLKNKKQIIERPQDMFLRTATTLQMGNLDKIKETYDLMSFGYYTHASPTLYNSGSNHMQLSSCFLLGLDDSLNSITQTWNACAQISKWAGGIGLHVSNVRGKNSLIKGTGGLSNGLVPFLRVFNDIARWIDQGGRRPGSIAIYIEPHHPDIFEFLDLRKNFGSETERARDLFLSLWISDLFMKQVESDGDWYLLSADTCPHLDDVYGDEFEKLYWKYVNENKASAVVKARKVWMAILDAQIETGIPYIGYKDSINMKCNQKNIGTIKSSNLCVHEDTMVLTSNGYYKIASLVNKSVKVWNGSSWSETIIHKTGTNKDLIRVTLSNGAFLDCTPEHKFYIVKDSETIMVEASKLTINDVLIENTLPLSCIYDKDREQVIDCAYNYGLLCTEESNEVPLYCNLSSRLEWFEGYFDIKGSIIDNTLQVTSMNKSFLLTVRLLLHTLGIESSIINNSLVISGKNIERLQYCGFKSSNVNFYNNIKIENNKVQVKVEKVEKSYTNVDTFCFTEPIKHMGMFNGILTGQCHEITEYSDANEYAVCNLASIALKSFVDPYKVNKDDKWTIYTKPNCKYCKFAMAHMKALDINFNMIDFTTESYNTLKGLLEKEDMTYPQIFHNDKLVGGWSDFYKYTAGKFNYNKLYNVAYNATINLDKVIDINYYPVIQAKISNMKHRPIGLGIQGLADALVLMKIPYDSDEAVTFNELMMETIYLASVKASNDMAKERYKDMKEFMSNLDILMNCLPEFYDPTYKIDAMDLVNSDLLRMNELYHKLKPNKYELMRDISKTTLGAYSSFDGSPMSEGKFQFDLWNHELNDASPNKDKWFLLREDVIMYGTRNSLLTALMPTASTSQILGNNECFEFFTNNIYTRKTLAGDFMLVNKYLVNDLININLWSNELKDMIIGSNGSIQNIDSIPSEIKAIYKTIWEIQQVWVLKGALARSYYVDQTQSMNIFMAEPDYQRLSSSHFWGWKNGLKTGMYYLRTRPSANAIKFTIDPNMEKKILNKIEDKEQGCESCSA